ncbi:MAG: hypothetical protein ABF274_03810 [Nonlabens sp.]|uniref:hypothetical protein n=1 Tax=Nonlabens sp. TaxID=1888209 RepID=UPI00321AF2D7
MRNSIKSIILCSLFFVGLTSFDNENKQLEDQQTPCQELAFGQAVFLWGTEHHSLLEMTIFFNTVYMFEQNCIENGGNENGTETLPVVVING